MPLTPQFKWRQTAAAVIVEVTLHGSDVDVELSPLFVKVSSPPYLLQLDLAARVDDAAARVSQDRALRRLTLEMPKEVAGALWDTLQLAPAAAGDRSALLARRSASVAERQARDAASAKGLVETRGEQARMSVRAQMDVEDRQRRNLEGVQLAQKKQAEAEVFEALAALTAATPPPLPQPQPQPLRSLPALPSSSSSSSAGASPPARPVAAAASSAATKSIFAPFPSTPSAALDEPTPLPPPRNRGTVTGSSSVKVSFTARAFPTPLRESRKKEEEDWLARNYIKLQQSSQQRKLGNTSGSEGPDARAPFAEKDAAWLKAKGDDFFRAGDFGGALNAYSAALAADADSLPCLLNRAACYLARCMPAQCVADCGAALALLPALPAMTTVSGTQSFVPSPAPAPSSSPVAPVTPHQRQQQLRALARRMAALAMEGRFQAALADARRAAAVEAGAGGEAVGGTGGGLAPVAARLASLARAAAAKEEGDAAAASNAGTPGESSSSSSSGSEAALARYAFALELEPRYCLALLNRSALFMRLERHADCLRDCERVLALLEGPKAATEGQGCAAAAAASTASGGGEDEGDEEDGEGEVSAVPVKGSPLFAQVQQRATARRAECRRHLGIEPKDDQTSSHAKA